MAKPRPEKKPDLAKPAEIRVLPMELHIGDRFVDATVTGAAKLTEDKGRTTLTVIPDDPVVFTRRVRAPHRPTRSR